MKTYIIKYLTNDEEDRVQYPVSSNGHGGSYTFTTRESDAQRFYRNIIPVSRTLATRIFNDAYCFFGHYIDIDALDETKRSIHWYQGYEIIEVDEEPIDTFEIRAALCKLYGRDSNYVVEDNFELNHDQEWYQQNANIKIYQLANEDLNNYYQWVKQNFKAKKEVPRIDDVRSKVDYYLKKLKAKYNGRRRSIGLFGAHL